MRFLILALLTPLIMAQSNARFDVLSIRHGLSQSSVTSIMQDAQGFMWFGTGNGLNKFDGYTFTTFLHDDRDSHSLSNNNIQSLYQDREGVYWIGTRNGLNILDPATKRFTSFKHTKEPSSLIHNSVVAIGEDREGLLWIGTNGGLDILDRKTDRFLHQDIKSLIWSIFESSSGTMWFCSEGKGLLRFDRSTGHFRSFVSRDGDLQSISSNRVFSITEDRYSNLWIATPNGLNRLDPRDTLFTRFLHDPQDSKSLSHNNIQAVRYDSTQNQIWMATFGGGINVMDIRSPGVFSNYRHNPQNLHSLAGDFAWTIYKDRSEVVWVGTYSNGISLLDQRAKEFSIYSQSPARGGLSHNHITSLAESKDGSIWIGTFGGGVNRLDRASKSTTSYHTPWGRPFGLTSEKIWAIFEDRKGVVWIGTDREGLNRLDPISGNVAVFKHFNSENIASNVIYRIHEDIEGLIWLGTGRGVSTYDKDKNIFTNYSFDPKDSNSVPDNFVASIAEVPDGSGIWFGTGGGACFWDRSSRRMKRLQKPQTLAGILTIYCQSRDDVWFGMEDRGLIRLFHDSITIYDKSMGLTSNSVYGVLPDSQGYLWLGTGLGLIKFDPKTGRSVVFNTGDGLMDDEFNQGAFLKTKRGELFFGGSHGVCSFFPDRIQNNQFVPPIAITSFKVFNQEIRSNFLEGDIVELPYNDNVFSFEFSALAYNNSAKNSYAYTMENFESQWNYVGQRRFAAYTNLDPGTYTFRVKGTNNDGIWNEKGTSIRMVIHPPFWRTWWFRLLIFIAVVGVLWTFYRLWEKRLLEIERLRVRIAGDLHDDVGATLTKISLYSELIRGGMDKHNHDSFLANINSMSREVITTMSDIVWSIDARNDFSDSLITHMRDFAYDLLTPKSIKIQFHIEGVEPQKVRSAFRQSVYLIFKESVNNIAKHADATEVTIHLQRQKQLFHMTIHDNGKGFDPERAKKGHGLRNLAMRAKQINGQLTIAESNGTKIELVVPWK